MINMFTQYYIVHKHNLLKQKRANYITQLTMQVNSTWQLGDETKKYIIGANYPAYTPEPTNTILSKHDNSLMTPKNIS